MRILSLRKALPCVSMPVSIDLPSRWWLHLSSHRAYAQFFTDVSPVDPDRQSFDRAVANQLMEGFPDGTFQPDTLVRPAESVMVRARFYHVLLRGFMVLPAPNYRHDPRSSASRTSTGSIPPRHFLAEWGMLEASDSNLAATGVVDTWSALEESLVHAACRHTANASYGCR